MSACARTHMYSSVVCRRVDGRSGVPSRGASCRVLRRRTADVGAERDGDDRVQPDGGRADGEVAQRQRGRRSGATLGQHRRSCSQQRQRCRRRHTRRSRAARVCTRRRRRRRRPLVTASGATPNPEFQNFLRRSWESLRKMTELTKSLGKGCEKLKKISRKTYDELKKNLARS